jgi:hypothetical protein
MKRGIVVLHNGTSYIKSTKGEMYLMWKWAYFPSETIVMFNVYDEWAFEIKAIDQEIITP